jgi:hypothetical protein
MNPLTQALGWIAFAAFCAAWFLPVIPDVSGWEAFRYALAPLVPFRDLKTVNAEDGAFQTLSALTNVVFVILFVQGFLKRAIRPGLWVRISIACLVLDLYWFVKAWREKGLADLLYGYYVWLLAFTLLLAVSALIASSVRRTSRIPTAGTPS